MTESEEDVGVVKIEGVEPNPEFVCIKKCFVQGHLVDPGVKMRLTGKEKFIKYFVEAAKAPVIEEEEANEPETFAGMQRKEAQDVIDQLNAGQTRDVSGKEAQEVIDSIDQSSGKAAPESAESLLG